MNIKMHELMNINTIYTEKISQAVLPLSTSYKLAKLSSLVSEEIDFYKKQLSFYIKIFAEQDANGEYVYSDKNSIKIQKGKEEECQKKIEELENMEITISDDFILSLKDLDGIKLSVSELQILLPLIKE